MKVQIIENEGKAAFAVVPIEEWERIQRALEDKADAEAVRRSLASNEEGIPGAVLDRILDGVHPLKALREWRGVSQEELAVAARTAAAYVSQIETGHRNLSGPMALRLAQALRVDRGLLRL